MAAFQQPMNMAEVEREGKLLLQYCKEGRRDDVNLLLSRGSADVIVNAKDEKGRTPLILFCTYGLDESIVALMLDKGAEVNSRDCYGRTALMCAVITLKKGKESIVRLLVERGADVNSCDKRGRSVLMKACECECERGENETVARFLLERGADVNLREGERVGGKTVLIRECIGVGGRHVGTRMVRMFCEWGVRVDMRDAYGRTGFMYACMHGNLAIVEFLMGQMNSNNNNNFDVNIDARDREGKSGFVYACEEGNTDVVQLMTRRGIDVNERFVSGRTGLMFACTAGHVGVADLLLRNGADIDAVDYAGKTALILAVENQRRSEDVVQLLLERRADVNVSWSGGKTALMLACELGRIGMAKSILTRGGANVNAREEVSGKTAFHYACARGLDSIVKPLIDFGADLNAKDNLGCTALMGACSQGRIKVVEALIDRGVDVNGRSHSEDTALFGACEHDHVKVVGLLLERGAHVNVSNERWCTPLMKACEKGHARVVASLLRSGAYVNERDEMFRTALMKACKHGHLKVVEMLIENGAFVNLLSRKLRSHENPGLEFYEHTALDKAFRNEHVQVVELLLERCPDVYVPDVHGGINVFDWACYQGHLKVVELLLERGIAGNVKLGDLYLWHVVITGHNNNIKVLELLIERLPKIDLRFGNVNELLMWACENGHLNVIELLIKRGMTITTRSDNQQGLKYGIWDTPFAIACKHNHVKIVEFLIQHGMHGMNNIVNEFDDRRMTPLMYASKNGHEGVVECLLKHGAYVNVRDAARNTPLMYACENGHAGVVERLLRVQHGAYVNEGDVCGFTSLMKCCRSGHVEVARLLIERAADLNVSSLDGRTPLMLACEHAHVDVVKVLIEHFGARVDVRDKDGDTPLTWACRGPGHDEKSARIVELLRRHGTNVNSQNKFGVCATMLATINDKAKCLEELLKEPPDLDVSNIVGQTVFPIAMGRRNTDCLRLLLTEGVLLSDGRLRPVHKNTKLVCNSLEPLLVTIEMGVFEWGWCPVKHFSPVSRAAIEAGYCPGQNRYDTASYHHQGEREEEEEKEGEQEEEEEEEEEGEETSIMLLSPLILSLLENDTELTQMCLERRYFYPEDYRLLSTQNKVRERIGEPLPPLMDEILHRPMSLLTWSLLTVSKSISVSGLPTLRRHRVDSLPLPWMLKAKLNFETDVP